MCGTSFNADTTYKTALKTVLIEPQEIRVIRDLTNSEFQRLIQLGRLAAAVIANFNL